jgi:hypothetical protein
MSDAERVLGRLEEFSKNAERRFDTLEKKVDSLLALKWKIAGGAAAISVVVTTLTMMFKK